MQRVAVGKAVAAERKAESLASSRSQRPATQSLHPILQLQQLAGNRAVGRFLQAKLRVGQPGDIHEQEADRVADEVLQSQDDGKPVPRKGIAHSISPLIQTKTTSPSPAASAATAAPDAVPSGGQPMPVPLSARFERAFGCDFSHVRVHTDARASESAAALNALAYTIGNDVVFASGQFAPGTAAGQRLLAHELVHVVQQRHATPRIQRKKNDAKPPPLLEVLAADFDEAARNFALMLATKPKIHKARIVVVNGPNVKVYDESGNPVVKKFFHLQAPVFLPIGVFGRLGTGRALHATGVGPGGEWIDAGDVQLKQTIDFQKDIDDQEGFDKALGKGMPTFFVSPRSTAVPPEADAPPPVPIENLPEFMEFEPKSKANLPAWPSATVPLTPQVATVNSTGTFKCTVDKNQGSTTIDRVTNLMQPTGFRWEVLKLDEKLHVTSKSKTSGWDAAAEGYARRKRNIEDDRKAMIGDPKKQSVPATVLKAAMADQVSNSRFILAMAGQTVMTLINAVTGGPNQLTTEDIMDVPYKEQGDFFVRCLATQIVPKDAKWHRATSVSGAMVTIYDIEELARSLYTAEELKTEAESSLEEVQADLKKLDQEIANSVGDPVIKRSERDYKALKIGYFKDLARAGSNPHDRKVAELNYERSALAFFDSPSYPGDPKYADFKAAQVADLKKREADLDAEVQAMRGRLKEHDPAIEPVAYMPAVLVDEMTGARMPLTFAVGERQYVAADKLEVVIADVSSAKQGRIFDGRGSGFFDAGRHDAWLDAMDDMRKNLNRGRGYLGYEVPKAYELWKSELPNPMQLQMSARAQIKEMVDDTAHVLTLAAIMAAPFTGGASLGILAVLAPIQAASSLYNIVNRALYNDLQMDSEAVFDFINIATLGLGKVSTAGKFASKGVRIIATSSRVAIRLLNAGQFVLVSYETFQALMETGDPEEDPRALRRKKLLKLLSWFEAASIPVSEKLFNEAHGAGSEAAKAQAEKQKELFFDEPTLVLGGKKKGTVAEGEFVGPSDRAGEAPRPGEKAAPGEKPVPLKATVPVAKVPGEKPAAPGDVQIEGTSATKTESATFKPTRAQLKGVPSRLQNKIAVVEGMGRDARVVYKRGDNGLITDVQIQIGEHTSAADVKTHVSVADLMLKYSGLGGRLRRLLENFIDLFTKPENQRPDIGSRGWEAKLELTKLDAMMRERHTELARIADLPLDQRDASRMAELYSDLDSLQSQFNEHADVFNAIEMATAQGRGYVAAEGLSEGERVRKELMRRDAPEGYQWRLRKGELEIVVIEEGKPKLLWDDAKKDFVEDKGARVPERFDTGIDRRKAFRELGGYEKESSFGSFVELLLDQKLIQSREDVIKAMSDPGGRTHDTVRGNVKDIFKARLVKQITSPAYLQTKGRYREVFKATGNKKQAQRAAAMDEMLRVTERLGSEDKGALAERVYDELFGTSKGVTQVDITPKELAAAKGIPEKDVDQGRRLDRMDGNTARELKNVTTRLGPRDRGEINDMLDLLGEEVQPRTGPPRKVQDVAVAFLDPQGGAANATLAHEFLKDNKGLPLTFEFHTADGKILKVTKKNMELLLKPDFRIKLGLPAD